MSHCRSLFHQMFTMNKSLFAINHPPVWLINHHYQLLVLIHHQFTPVIIINRNLVNPQLLWTIISPSLLWTIEHWIYYEPWIIISYTEKADPPAGENGDLRLVSGCAERPLEVTIINGHLVNPYGGLGICFWRAKCVQRGKKYPIVRKSRTIFNHFQGKNYPPFIEPLLTIINDCQPLHNPFIQSLFIKIMLFNHKVIHHNHYLTISNPKIIHHPNHHRTILSLRKFTIQRSTLLPRHWGAPTFRRLGSAPAVVLAPRRTTPGKVPAG